MKKIIVLSFLAISLCTLPAYALEPSNLQITKNALMKYESSGEYTADLKSVSDQAKAYLKTRLEHPGKKPIAIVFDIDETVLSNYQNMVDASFGGTPEEIDQEEGKASDPAIPSSLDLYRYAKDNKVAIFFVTGRTEKSRLATEKNLRDAGYTAWDDLIFKPTNYHEKTVAIYKAGARKNITDKGYDIVISIGDQETDLAGGYADKTFKLPNPYYFLP